MISINGQFTARRMTGQERFAFEIVLELDKICKGEFELVVPQNAINIPILKNISIVKYGRAKGALWEQTCLAWYLLKKHRMSLNLCTNMPLLRPGYICIHDISYAINPQFFQTFYSKISVLWHKLQYRWAWWFAPKIFTVSNKAKEEIVNFYKVSPQRIVVIGNGWQHFERVKLDNSIFKRIRGLKKKKYFFSLGSLSLNKNINWILENAKHNPHYKYVITGHADPNNRGIGAEIRNVIFTGYLKDEEVKSLMKYCRAFIFPSIYEGFGIPPLEALSIGVKVIVSNTSCLPEIFGNSVYYIDPYISNVNLDELLNMEVEEADVVLRKYNYHDFAKSILEILVNAKYVVS